jgi:hypothetical protein
MRIGLVLVVCCLVATATHAQWLNYPTPGVPRTKDGKVNLTAPMPKTADGKPDLSGVWHVQPTGLAEMKRLFGNDVDVVQVPGMEIDTISKYGISVFMDFKPGDEPVRKEAADLRAQHQQRSNSGLDNLTRCLPASIPLATMLSEVTKIVQTPGLTLIMHEIDNATRQIYTDGRPHPVDPNPSWLGYSTGRWEKDALVVETIGFNGKAPLDISGHPRSESMRITERYQRRDVGHLDVAITFDDPVNYTRPFTINVTHLLQPDTDILEYFCNENERDRAHMGPGK